MFLQYRSVHSHVYNMQFLVDNNDTGSRYCIIGGLALLCKTRLLFLSLILWWQHSSRSIGLFSHSTVSFYFVVYARHLLCSYYVRQCQNSGSCTLGCVNLCVSSYVLLASLLILLRHLMSRRMRVCMYLMIILSYWDLHVFKVTHRVFGCLGSFCQWHAHSVYVCAVVVAYFFPLLDYTAFSHFLM